MYQPVPKHPRMDLNSPHGKSQGAPFHPQSSMSQRRIMMKPPSTLSLDAEPFYPTNFPSKSHQGNPRMMDPHKYPQDYTPESSVGTILGAHVSAPPGFSPEDAVYVQHGPYLEKHYKQDYSAPPGPGHGHMTGPGVRPRTLPPHHGKPATPSPPSPTYNAAGDGPHFPYMEHPGVEPQEHVPAFHTTPTHPTHTDVQMYDGAEDHVYPPVGGRRFLPDQRRDHPPSGLEAHLAAKAGGRRVTPTSVAGPYNHQEQYLASLHHHQHRQHMGGGGVHRSSRGEHAVPPSGFTVTGQRSLWENPNAYRLQPIPGGEEPAFLQHQQEYLRRRGILLKMYQREQAALEAAVAREQAKRSAETLSTLNQPYRSGRSTVTGGGKADVSSPVGVSGENLWEGMGGAGSLHDPVVLPQGYDDSESIVRQRQMQQYLAGQQAARSRMYSGDSDIGGEFVSNPVQVPSSIGHPGLNRAPGHGTSESRGQTLRSSLDQHTSSGWPSRSRSEGSKFSKLWSQESSTLGGFPDDQSGTNTNLPFGSNTYDLFEHQSIWSMSNSDSSGLLSWAQYRPDTQQPEDSNPDE